MADKKQAMPSEPSPLRKYGVEADPALRKQGIYQDESWDTLPVPKKGSQTVPKFARGGKVIKSESY